MPISATAWHDDTLILRLSGSEAGIKAAQQKLGGEVIEQADGFWQALRDRKLQNLLATQPEMIVSANIGCQTHLQSGTEMPVRHWIEIIDQALK